MSGGGGGLLRFLPLVDLLFEGGDWGRYGTAAFISLLSWNYAWYDPGGGGGDGTGRTRRPVAVPRFEAAHRLTMEVFTPPSPLCPTAPSMHRILPELLGAGRHPAGPTRLVRPGGWLAREGGGLVRDSINTPREVVT